MRLWIPTSMKKEELGRCVLVCVRETWARIFNLCFVELPNPNACRGDGLALGREEKAVLKVSHSNRSNQFSLRDISFSRIGFGVGCRAAT